MERMPTQAAEEIYSVLMKYAEASPRYYDREGFIYCFGVVPNPSKKFRLSCMDGRRRVFARDGDGYSMTGKGYAKVNSIINNILKKIKMPEI